MKSLRKMYASLGSGAVLIEMHVRLGVFVAGTVPELKKIMLVRFCAVMKLFSVPYQGNFL